MKRRSLFKKVDKRNTGYPEWKYIINYPGYVRQQMFYKWREWCWQTWGPSKEIDAWKKDMNDPNAVSQNSNWCFQHDQYSIRIYLRSDKDLSMFLLRWTPSEN